MICPVLSACPLRHCLPTRMPANLHESSAPLPMQVCFVMRQSDAMMSTSKAVLCCLPAHCVTATNPHGSLHCSPLLAGVLCDAAVRCHAVQLQGAGQVQRAHGIEGSVPQGEASRQGRQGGRQGRQAGGWVGGFAGGRAAGGRWAGGRAGRLWAGGLWAGGQALGGQTGRRVGKNPGRWADEHAGRRLDTHTDKQIDRQLDRRSGRHVCPRSSI